MTPDTYEQMDRRISRIEAQIDQILVRMDQGFTELRAEIRRVSERSDTRFMWLVGILLGTLIPMWVTIILAILLK